jgi:hypothetical protein
MPGKSFSLLATILVLASAVCPQAIQKELEYKDRGDRWEGIIQPKKSGNKIELMSAIAAYQETSSAIPASLAIRFYLKDQSPVSVTVRGVRVAENYWMNNVRPPKEWEPGFGNEFRWPTSDVIQQLKAQVASMYDFGVVVCLGTTCDTTDNLTMTVAPVFFYYSTLPKSIDSYLFTFKPIARESLIFKLFEDFNGDSKGPALTSQVFSDVPAGVPFNVLFDAPKREGWYQLKAAGITALSQEDVTKTIRFYHAQVRTK